MLINKMKYLTNLTSQEKHIVNYIFEHPETIFEATAFELSKLTYTSSSTIVRLCKKLGAKGYPDFQLKFALEYKEKYKIEDSRDLNLSGEKGELNEIIDSIPFVYEQALTQTRRLFNEDSLLRINDWIRESDRIHVYGVDAHYYTAQQACSKWSELGFNAVAYNSVNQHYLMNSKNDVSTISFIISQTGTNKAIIDIAKTLKRYKMKVVAITASDDTVLLDLCDEYIKSFASSEPAHLTKMFSMISIQYIFDVLYLNTVDN